MIDFEAASPAIISHSSTDEWWRGAVIYQIYPRSFYDSNHDGIGDLQGVIAKLDYIADLGVNAIWLSPFFTSPQADFGYDVSDYTDIDPIYGNLHDFDDLIRRAHALGIKVLIDQVWSHTSDKHAWFMQSRTSQDNAKSDWYVWADPSNDGTPPNNWLSVFGGSAWRWEPRRRQYYLHHFLKSQPSLNYDNPAVVEAILETGRFWLDRGVDGFRLDAIDFLKHDPLLRNNPAAPMTIIPSKPFGLQCHHHDMLHPSRFEVIKKIRNLMDEYPGTTTIGEVSSQPNAFRRIIEYTEPDKLHMAYTLRLMRGDFDYETIKDSLKESMLANASQICWAFSNHDVERVASRWNPNKNQAPDHNFVCMLTMMLLSMRGGICIYQGEELGLTEAELSYDELRDPFGLTYYPEFKGRDGSRTPMPWNHDKNAGFSDNDLPWLPVARNHERKSVKDMDENSILALWRTMISLRNQSIALKHGSISILDFEFPILAFVREFEDQKVLCAFNCSDQSMTFRFPDYGEYHFEPYEGMWNINGELHSSYQNRKPIPMDYC